MGQASRLVCRILQLYKFIGGRALISLSGWANLKARSRFTRWTIYWGFIMQWTAPVFEEVCLNCEINSYASAKL